MFGGGEHSGQPILCNHNLGSNVAETILPPWTPWGEGSWEPLNSHGQHSQYCRNLYPLKGVSQPKCEVVQTCKAQWAIQSSKLQYLKKSDRWEKGCVAQLPDGPVQGSRSISLIHDPFQIPPGKPETANWGQLEINVPMTLASHGHLHTCEFHQGRGFLQLGRLVKWRWATEPS